MPHRPVTMSVISHLTLEDWTTKAVGLYENL